MPVTRLFSVSIVVLLFLTASPLALGQSATPVEPNTSTPILNAIILFTVVPITTALIGAMTAYFTMRHQLAQKKLELEHETKRAENSSREKREAEERALEQEAKRKAAEAAVTIAVHEVEVQAKEANRNAQKADESAEVAARASEDANAARQEMRQLEEGIDLPKQPPPGHRRCSMLLAGIGGVGKSMLLEKCFKWKAASSNGKTATVETFGTDFDFSPKANERGLADEGNRVRCWVTDYVGQNLGTLVRYFVEQQKVAWSPVAYGHINALCLMVDLKHPTDFEYSVKVDGEEEQVEVARTRLRKGEQRVAPDVIKSRRNAGEDLNPGEPDMDRVDQHLRKWNDQALNAVFGLLTDESLRKVCIFVNKVDMMNDTSAVKLAQYKMFFEPLRKRLQERFNNKEVAVIIGSAKAGTGHPDIESMIYEAADPEVAEPHAPQVLRMAGA